MPFYKVKNSVAQNKLFYSLGIFNEKGSSVPLFISKNKNAKKEESYLIKMPENKNAASFYYMSAIRQKAEASFDIDELRATYEKLQTLKDKTLSTFENFKKVLVDDQINKYLENWDNDGEEDEYKTQLEVFSGEFIRYVDANCSPKYYVFIKHSPEENKEAAEEVLGNEPEEVVVTPGEDYGDAAGITSFIGSKFLKDYTDASDCYVAPNPETNTPALLFNHPITADLEVDNGTQKKPIIGLGRCAVLRYLFSKIDCSASNWGFVETADDYRVCLLDFGRCLWDFNFNTEDLDPETSAEKKTEVSEEAKLIIENQNPNLLLKIVFEDFDKNLKNSGSDSDTDQVLTLPKEAYTSERVKNEILETIEFLKKLSHDDLKKLMAPLIYKFPYHHDALIKELMMGIQHLDKVMQLANTKKLSKDEIEPEELQEQKRRRI